MALSNNTFLSTVTLTCLLLNGGPDPTKQYKTHQLWHSNVVGHEDRDIDYVLGDEFPTSIAFWEQNVSFLPSPGCVAVVVGEVAFVLDKLEGDTVSQLSMKVRATQVNV